LGAEGQSIMAIATTHEADSPRGNVALQRMVFGWWNTSLSPVGRNRADDDHQEIATTVVRSLIDELGVDCLALGEVTNNDLSTMMAACKATSLSVYEGTLKEGRLQFDTGIIYNNACLALAGAFSTTSMHGTRNYKISNHVNFVSVADGLPLHVFISHWPSRGINEENLLSRKTIACRLKNQLHDLTVYSPNAAIIVMGDFNDEPFDESLSWHLLATRDRYLVQTKRGYLYNPFWRKLGESQAYARSLPDRGVAGTCFYKGTTDTRWRTFDQILFSSAFFGKSAWHLKEEHTAILTTDFLIDLIKNDEVHFDHLPIVGVIERFEEVD
jgi:hypothetical protein